MMRTQKLTRASYENLDISFTRPYISLISHLKTLKFQLHNVKQNDHCRQHRIYFLKRRRVYKRKRYKINKPSFGDYTTVLLLSY
ncbi:hypothetical protein RIR_jg11498.t1 [Rhizophagus irregularis DAOM 181602=DAOM 197198]|uniref:Uncharacterized protein n=1 Tax=Rhizophagus irregularis (strain DAOM 181602 / DAOM 197198 / MUCL 43194) TaxID=747089 RepID=U9U465_RHIID|nr:hypothetical protein RIR_jg11498.t1 [Rhizophagus irregularis DAOM 181602=DAOM 197198]